MPPAIIDEELQQMRRCRVARAANRSVVGIMTELTHLAEVYRDSSPSQICSISRYGWPQRRAAPLYDRSVTPERELGALLRSIAT